MTQSTDMSTYGQSGNSGLNQIVELAQLKNNIARMNANKTQSAKNNTTLNNTASTSPGSYGSGTNMSMLGAGSDYGSSPMSPSLSSASSNITGNP